jgi:small redox-active disulfide protein 2
MPRILPNTVTRGGTLEMKKIQVLGTGCPKCRQLAENAEIAATKLGIEFELEKITDITDIVNCGLMTTPGLIIDGEIKSAGKLPAPEEIMKMLAEEPAQ